MSDFALANPVAPADLLAFCKATADGLRLDILRVLRDESFGVLELCRIFDMAQPGMSHHLKVLASANLVETRREGNSIFYRRPFIVKDHPLGNLLGSLLDAVDRVPLSPEVVARMDQVHGERARRSHEFFEKHGEELGRNQQLIARLDQYDGAVRDLLVNENLPAEATVLEVGPGASEMINLLASRFARVIALDNSAEMLGYARGALDPALTEKVAFIEGEPEDLATRGTQVDLMLLNMVLHHLPSPARLFRTAWRLLVPGGHLLIIYLRPHDQDWTRDICGDLWLGFEPDDLDEWATDAGLEKGQSIYIGLKNGFQVQVRLFHRPLHSPTEPTKKPQPDNTAEGN